MSENNQKVVKFDLVKEIRTEYNQAILNWLKDNHYNYNVWEIKDLSPYQTKEENHEKTHFIAIPDNLYNDLDKLCRINNWDTDKKIIELLKDDVFSAEIVNRNGFKQVINF